MFTAKKFCFQKRRKMFINEHVLRPAIAIQSRRKMKFNLFFWSGIDFRFSFVLFLLLTLTGNNSCELSEMRGLFISPIESENTKLTQSKDHDKSHNAKTRFVVHSNNNSRNRHCRITSRDKLFRLTDSNDNIKNIQ